MNAVLLILLIAIIIIVGTFILKIMKLRTASVLLKEDKKLLYQLASENVAIKEKLEKMQSQIADLDQEVFALKSAHSYTYQMWKNKDMYQQAG
ncbi:MAG: hypothetical protein H7Y04_02330 [Verrucomicrobia bacterium]|nr:hypothetical protein [Cytophagales bacterium]